MSADNLVRTFPKKKFVKSISMLISFLKLPVFNRFLIVKDQQNQKLYVFVLEIISIIPELLCKNYCRNGTRTRTISFCFWLSGNGTRTVIEWNHKR
jgi:hypothetical protein